MNVSFSLNYLQKPFFIIFNVTHFSFNQTFTLPPFFHLFLVQFMALKQPENSLLGSESDSQRTLYILSTDLIELGFSLVIGHLKIPPLFFT